MKTLKDNLKIHCLPQPATQEDQDAAFVKIITSLKDDPRLKIVVIMRSGARAIVVIPEHERQKLEQLEPRAINANVLIVTELQATELQLI